MTILYEHNIKFKETKWFIIISLHLEKLINMFLYIINATQLVFDQREQLTSVSWVK